MLNKIKHSIDNTVPVMVLWGAALVWFVISKWVQVGWLDRSYIASKFPVPFFEGQTTFNAAVTKSHFQVLVDEGTLGLFWQTQCIDYVYMLATFIFTFLVMAAIYKSMLFNQNLQKISWFMVLVMPFNAIMDAFENLFSFIMLANPADFLDWLVIPYSSFAVAKFALYGVGYLWILIAVAILLGRFLQLRIRAMLKKHKSLNANKL